MNERRRIEDRLRKKEQEIQELEEKVKNGRVYIQALQDVLKLLPKEPDAAKSASTLRPGSAMEQARGVLRDAGEPLHVDDILRRMGKAVTRETKVAVSGSIAAYVRRGEIFTRPAPNTFGLVEFGGGRDKRNAEPPEDFGATTEDDGIPF